MRRHFANLVNWYLTPIGALFGLLVVAGATLSLLGYPIAAVACAVLAVGVILPYKLSRPVEPAGLRDMSRALDALKRDLAKLENRFAAEQSRSKRESRDRIAQLRSQVSEIRSEVRDMRHLQVEAMTRVEGALNRVERVSLEVEGRINAIEDRSVALESQMSDSTRQIREELKGERNERIIGVARSRGSNRHSEGLLLILTPPRTGSTWLFDSLRAHPDILFEPTPHALEPLGLSNMNRYPAALSNGQDAYWDVEVGPGQGARVPDYSIDRDRLTDVPRYSVEKIHPMFYDFDTSRLIERLDAMEERGSLVRLIVRLRDPEYTIRSIMRYKQRDRGWLDIVPMAKVPAYLERSLRSILEVTRAHPALLSRYEDHAKDPVQSMAELYMALWPDSPAEYQKEMAGEISQLLMRRRRTRGRFLGSSPSEADPGGSEIDMLIDDGREVIETCRRLSVEIEEAINSA